uniref:TFIIS N-terminal domain-containing protein n=1 Tax=Tanacetum cinerariifolium TaxID=118510 RepID=A0A6L2MWV9_TANCI|nr:hypothetical protein [Tanacetum cinerariifolium]
MIGDILKVTKIGKSVNVLRMHGSKDVRHIARGLIEKILIVDWDIHHENATQKMFWKDSQVLVFSFHRHENKSFYLGGDDGSHVMVGEGPAFGDPLGGCRVSHHGYSILLKKVREILITFWTILAKMLPIKLTSRVTPLPEKLKAKAVKDGGLIKKQNIAIEECEKDLQRVLEAKKWFKDKLLAERVQNEVQIKEKNEEQDNTLTIKDNEIEALKQHVASLEEKDCHMASAIITKDKTLAVKDKEIDALK